LVLDEFRLLYAAERSGRTAPDLPPETDYVSYVLAEAASLTSPAGERLRAFWEEQLAGELAALNMPTDRARPSTPTTQGDSCAFVLTRELSDLIRSLARAEETTAYMFLLASLLVLLRRMTGQDDVIITSPTSGRTRPEYAETVGLFVNRVVIRAKVSGTQTFREFLAQVRRTILLALEHQDYPFPLLFQRLQRDRQPSPLSQVSFNFLKAQRGDQVYSLFVAGGEASRMNVGGLELEPFELAQQEGQLDLSLLVLETEGVFHGSFKFSLDLFDRPTVAQISKQYLTLLESIVADPDNTIARLPIMSVDDRQQMVMAWRTIAEAS
jgi:non-ribosomal peptide synthetase component F